MKSLYSRLLALLCLAVSLPSLSMAQSDAPLGMEYSYDDGSTRLALWGTGKKETYDVAIKIDGQEALKGTTVSGVYLYLPETQNISNLQLWMSHTLTLDTKKQNVPDICTQKVDSTLAFTQTYIPFEKPYTLTGDPIYLGYSFTVPATDKASLNPLLLSYNTTEGGFYIHTSKKYMKWMEMNSVGNLALVALLTNAPANNAYLRAQNVYTQGDSVTYTPFTLVNAGAHGVRSFVVSTTLNGVTTSQKFTPSASDTIPNRYGAYNSYNLKLTAPSADGAYPVLLQLTQLNGEDLAADGHTAQAVMDVRRFVPRHRSVLEEYTGTWCSNCPRGFAAMLAMKRLYPGDFIGLAYHGASGYNKDPMKVMETADFPMTVNAFPMASLDRLTLLDPYYGSTTTNGFGIDDEWLAQTLTYAPANIDVNAVLSEDGTEVRAEATVTSPREIADKNYKVEFVLLANYLHGDTSDWSQENAYTNASMSDFEIPEMEQFVGRGSSVSGLAYEDVVVATTRLNNHDVYFTSPIEAYTPLLAKGDFDLTKVCNTEGKNLIQDPTALNVVALLIDCETGQVANANLCTVDATDYIASVHDATLSPSSTLPTACYDLAGRRVNNGSTNAKGVYILQNGAKVVRK